jgi:hypothetical protein
MSEKKDINRAPDDNLESGELYGVKTNPNPQATDAVFGEISEDGPNFRSVCHGGLILPRCVFNTCITDILSKIFSWDGLAQPAS